MEPNLTIHGHNHYIRVSCFKNVSNDSTFQPSWPTWLEIGHTCRGKMQFLAYICEVFKANLTVGKSVHHADLDLSARKAICCWVAAPELVILHNFAVFGYYLRYHYNI